ncbi:MAG TPA: tRNA (adenosine(37)-N6)-dimethylallyltransferase MiaA [Bacteroidales bacterium]|nr:tRNA (adenosine(37)-N6)-dimethylallyltransferase MiaA [Bacteroidales bacterium]
MKYLIVISGPTAVGKTKVAIDIALHYKTEIISADSRQFYKEIPIGTAAPTFAELQTVGHHCIGNLHITDYYNAFKFEQDALHILDAIFLKNDYAILCGGSGMYIDAVCNGIDDIPDIDIHIRETVTNQYATEGIESLRRTLLKLDPEYYNRVDLKNPARLIRAIEVCLQTGKTYTSVRTNSKKQRHFTIIKIALNIPREQLYSKINHRVDYMVQNGLEQEVMQVIQYRNHTALKTVGYREFFEYVDGVISKERAIEAIKQNTRNYAKRQISWLKRDSAYTWFNPADILEIIAYINQNSIYK